MLIKITIKEPKNEVQKLICTKKIRKLLNNLKSLCLKFKYSTFNIVCFKNDKLTNSDAKDIANGCSVHFSN